MNINTEKIQQLLGYFSDLDDTYQNNLISHALYLNLKQKEDHNISNNIVGPEREQLITNKVKDKVLKITELIDKFEDADNDIKSMLAIVMENILPGAFTKKEKINVNITTERISMVEYFKNKFPGINYSLQKDKVDKIIKSLEK